MELIAAILLAGPLGYFARTGRQGLIFYLIAWTVIFPVQTVAVFSDNDASGNDWLYWLFNAIILAAGIGLNRLGRRIRVRRRELQGGLVMRSAEGPGTIDA
jgi:hypothetical protein